MAKLTDTQSILLAHAAQNRNGSIHPLPPSMVDDGANSERAAKAIEQLIARGLAEERETSNASEARRTDGDLSHGLFITSIGLTAIGIDADAGDSASRLASNLECAPFPVIGSSTNGSRERTLRER